MGNKKSCETCRNMRLSVGWGWGYDCLAKTREIKYPALPCDMYEEYPKGSIVTYYQWFDPLDEIAVVQHVSIVARDDPEADPEIHFVGQQLSKEEWVEYKMETEIFGDKPQGIYSGKNRDELSAVWDELMERDRDKP